MPEHKNLFKIVYINLDHRTDRREKFEQSMIAANFDMSEVDRFSAVKDEFGEIGCAKSHFLALSEMICREPAQYFIILEDDFKISISQEQLVKLLKSFNRHKLNFDMLDLFPHLAKVFPLGKLKVEEAELMVFRTMLARNTTGYIVPRQKAFNFAKVYLKSIKTLENNRWFLKNKETRQRMQRYGTDGEMALQLSQAMGLHIAFDFEFGTTLDTKSDIIEYRKHKFEHRYSPFTTFGFGKKCSI